ncbi:MAG TPA: VacJ family lipoprotein [Azospira sp.]|nr:VacJ family lipoprotein [Azospira sp.]
MKNLRLGIAMLCCAGAVAQAQQSDPGAPSKDPLERYNRAVFEFNDALDRAVLSPLARGYQTVVPELMRQGVTNFFGNFADGWSAINQALQGKGEAAATMTMRVVTNSFFGIGGVFDVASDLGMERQSEDFGQTLGRWGVPAGAYFVWPVLGPSTIRDSVGRPLDLAWSPSAVVEHGETALSLTLLNLVDTRANLLSASKVLDGIALDRYTFVRDAYLARRRNQVYDGDPPEEAGSSDEPPVAAPVPPSKP